MGASILLEIARVTQREQLLAAGRLVGMTQLPDKLAALVSATRIFEREGVAYALIGGVAVGIRSGVPRSTLDVDFAIPTSVDKDEVTRALLAHGFVLKGRFPHSINFVHASGEPVQLAFDPEFDPMIERAGDVAFGDLRIRVVTREDLIVMKRRAASDPGRRRSKALRDQADVALLEGDVPSDDDGW